jgi:hypothetical protein
MGSSSLDRLHHDLKMIASVRPGDKLFISEGCLQILHSGVAGAVWRWARGDTRSKSLAAATECINDALALAEHRVTLLQSSAGGCCDERQRALACHLIDEIDRAATGLRHLRITYISDLSCQASLEVLRERIANRLRVLRTRLGEDFNSPRRDDVEAERAVLYLTDGGVEPIAYD